MGRKGKKRTKKKVRVRGRVSSSAASKESFLRGKPAFARKKSAIERIPSGIPGIDDLVEGGFEKGSIVVVVGGPGTGKTTMAAQFLYNGAQEYDETGVLLNLEQNSENFRNHMKEFGMDFGKLEKEGKITLLTYNPNEIIDVIKGGGGMLKDAIDSVGAKRFAVDSLTAMIMFYERKYEARKSLINLFSALRGWRITTMAVVESHIHESHSIYPTVEFLSDAVILLRTYYEGNVRNHALEILKMRATNHSKDVSPYYIMENGVVVFSGEKVFEK